MADELIAQLTKWCYTVAATFAPWDSSRDTAVFPSIVCVVWVRMNPQACYTPAVFFNTPNPVSLPSRTPRARDMLQGLRKNEMQQYIMSGGTLPDRSGGMDFGYCAENPALM